MTAPGFIYLVRPSTKDFRYRVGTTANWEATLGQLSDSTAFVVLECQKVWSPDQIKRFATGKKDGALSDGSVTFSDAALATVRSAIKKAGQDFTKAASEEQPQVKEIWPQKVQKKAAAAAQPKPPAAERQEPPAQGQPADGSVWGQAQARSSAYANKAKAEQCWQQSQHPEPYAPPGQQTPPTPEPTKQQATPPRSASKAATPQPREKWPERLAVLSTYGLVLFVPAVTFVLVLAHLVFRSDQAFPPSENVATTEQVSQQVNTSQKPSVDLDVIRAEEAEQALVNMNRQDCAINSDSTLDPLPFDQLREERSAILGEMTQRTKCAAFLEAFNQHPRETWLANARHDLLAGYAMKSFREWDERDCKYKQDAPSCQWHERRIRQHPDMAKRSRMELYMQNALDKRKLF